MGRLMLDLINAGHLAGLVLLLLAIGILVYQLRVLSANGLTKSLILFLSAVAMEKLWSIGQVVMTDVFGVNTFSPATFWDYFMLGWRSLAIWGTVFALLYLFYATFLIYTKAPQKGGNTDHEQTGDKAH